MSAFGGICNWNGQPIDPQLLVQMDRRMQWMGPDQQGRIVDHQAGLVQCTLVASPRQAMDTGPVRCPHTGLVAAADSRIDNWEELAEVLHLNPSRQTPTDVEIILAAYRRWGERAPEKLIGDFAFAIWDPRQQLFFCARDRMGVRPLYSLHQPGFFACASHPATLLALPGVSAQHNEQRLACFLLHILPEDTATFYESVHRLPPGCWLQARAAGVTLRQYWSPHHAPTIKHCDEREYVDEFRDLFTTAVRCRIQSQFPVGSTLSGGLDSSSITCAASTLLQQQQGEQLHTFSAVFPSLPAALLARIDERSYMEAARRHCPRIISHDILADRLHPFAMLAENAHNAGQPFFGPNMYIHNAMYAAAAQQGVKVFLDGIDGDSVVSYGFERLPHLLLTGRWTALAREIGALKATSNSRQSLARLLGSYAVKPSLAGLVEWLGLGRILPVHRRADRISLLQPDFKQRVNAHELLHRHCRRMRLPIVDPSANHRASLALPFLSHVLEIAGFTSAGWAIEARYPFLDHRLVEYCLSLPVEQKLSGGWSRAIQRKAMVGMAPDSIVHRLSKADLSPNYYAGIAQHGPMIIEEIIRPASPLLSEYLYVDQLLPLLESTILAPEQHPQTALFFFTVASLAAWLSSPLLR